MDTGAEKGNRPGTCIGPRVFSAGPMLAGQPYFSFSLPLRNSEEAVAATRKAIESGADYIKVHTEVTPELARAISQEAHRLGKRVIGHLGSYVDASSPW